MEIIDNSQNLIDKLNYHRKRGTEISLIPTMGNLHKGHLELFCKAPKDTFKVVSIFVNPLQFNDNNDYIHYPRSLNHDLDKCKECGVDLVYAPLENITEEINPERNIDLPKFTKYLCGASRENHFRGVYKIVKHLFSQIKPVYACFGKKDYQQLLLIKYIAKTYFPDMTIIEVDTIRENNIALSSRLSRLDDRLLDNASIIYTVLMKIKKSLINGNDFLKIRDEFIKKIEDSDISVEYLEHRKNDTLELADGTLDNSSLFIAYAIGSIRLIDNIQI